MKAWQRVLAGFSWLCLAACTHVSRHEKLQAEQYADTARSSAISCATGCAINSPLRALGDAAYAASRPGQPRHSVLMLDSGQDSLLARVHLIRSARTSIDLQTFHFERDDAGRVVLDELRAAAARGVRVRLLLDQLNSLTDPELQAGLAAFHRNFEMRLYNPVFLQARVNPLEFAGAVLFRFRNLNQRMHSKIMLVDGRVAILGGRNIQDEYFDWNDQYDYRDRDVLIAGPVTQEMTRYFNAFWNDRRAVPAARLDDVARVLLENRGPPTAALPPRSARVVAMAKAAEDGEQVFVRLSPYLYRVGRVDFFGDLPSKHADNGISRSAASQALLNAFAASKRELLLQTPYLVLSRAARRLFRALQRRPRPVSVLVSTNSLAATDAFPVYAMSYKYKRLYLRELGFQIYEYKPFPADMPVGLSPMAGGDAEGAATGDVGNPEAQVEVEKKQAKTDVKVGKRKSRHRLGNGPVPLMHSGVRIGLHCKSMVIDGKIAIIGSHNFDPRSNDYSAESLVMVHDAAFAHALEDSIRRDMSPDNAWVIAPRPKLPFLWGLNYNLGKLSEKLPIFDIWPLPYATSYQLKPGCQPLPLGDPGFQACYEDVGDFPEVNLSLKMIYTRVITVFGAGFIPIL